MRWRRIGRLRPDEVVETKGSMLRHDPQWRFKQTINAVGALLTTAVIIVFAATKFMQGAWIIVILIPALVWIFRRKLSLGAVAVPPPPVPIIHLVLISAVHAAALRQVQFVQSLGFKWIAVHVATDEEKAAEVRRRWERFFPRESLVVLPSPIRDLVIRECQCKL